MSQSHASMALQMDTRTRATFRIEPLLGLCLGALGGALQGSLLASSLVQTILCGGLFGLVFGLFFAKRAISPGAGLIWGLALALLAWIVFPAGILPMFEGAGSRAMLSDARERFPQLVAFLLCLGMPVGTMLGIWGGLHSKVAQA